MGKFYLLYNNIWLYYIHSQQKEIHQMISTNTFSISQPQVSNAYQD